MTTFNTPNDLLRGLTSSGTALRPILTRLTNDNSWLISIPRPAEERQNVGKVFFHLLVDLWLIGELDPLPYLPVLHIARREEAKYGSAKLIEELIAEIEAGVSLSSSLKTTTTIAGKSERDTNVDAILVSLSLDDHMHYDSMIQFSPSIPVLAASDAAPTIDSWKHFETVVSLPTFDLSATAWPDTGALGPSVPDWLRIFFIPDKYGRFPGVNHCVPISFPSSKADAPSDARETILHTPHGVQPPIVKHAARLAPPNNTFLAMIHGMNEEGLAAASLGVKMGLQIADIVKVRYWVRTHDELKYTKLLSWFFTYRTWISLEEGVEAIRKDGKLPGVSDNGEADDEALEDSFGEKLPPLFQVANGGSLVLV